VQAHPTAGGDLRRGMAVVETTTQADDLKLLLNSENLRPNCSVEACAESPPGYHWLNLSVVDADQRAVLRSMKSALTILLDAADRGVLRNFRIVTGADVLRIPLPVADVEYRASP
jgi:hypothetical protein